jgi:5'-deoxynucleotidase YfbR-like HD superfamily hydrolase
MNDVLKLSDEEILAIAHQLRVGYAFKRVLRFNTTRDQSVHSESDAEHVFGLIYLAEYFARVELVGKSLNLLKLHNLLLFHDFGEIKYGDINTYEKNQSHIDREREAAKEVFASLPEPLDQLGLEAWQEYEDHKSPEARFAYALDKIEPLFELLDPVNERSVKRLKITVEMHLGNKVKAVVEYPVMARFVDVLTKDMVARGVFWES